MTLTGGPTTPARAGLAGAEHRATFAHALRAELTKLYSLWSTHLTLLAMFVLIVSLGFLVSGGAAEQYRDATPAQRQDFYPMAEPWFVPIVIGQLAVAVLGVLMVTSEYATGTIRPTLTAVARRGRLLAAKICAFTMVVLPACLITTFALFAVGQAALAAAGAPRLALGDPHVLRSVVGAALYLTVVGLLSLAVGALVRATAGAIAIMFAAAILAPMMLPGLLPGPVGDWIGTYWPTLAGLSVALAPDPDSLAPWPGFAVLGAFTAAMLALAYAVFRYRDA